MRVDKIDAGSESLTLKRIFDAIDLEVDKSKHFVDQIMNSTIAGKSIKSCEESLKKRFFNKEYEV